MKSQQLALESLRDSNENDALAHLKNIPEKKPLEWHELHDDNGDEIKITAEEMNIKVKEDCLPAILLQATKNGYIAVIRELPNVAEKLYGADSKLALQQILIQLTRTDQSNYLANELSNHTDKVPTVTAITDLHTVAFRGDSYLGQYLKDFFESPLSSENIENRNNSSFWHITSSRSDRNVIQTLFNVYEKHELFMTGKRLNSLINIAWSPDVISDIASELISVDDKKETVKLLLANSLALEIAQFGDAQTTKEVINNIGNKFEIFGTNNATEIFNTIEKKYQEIIAHAEEAIVKEADKPLRPRPRKTISAAHNSLITPSRPSTETPRSLAEIIPSRTSIDAPRASKSKSETDSSDELSNGGNNTTRAKKESPKESIIENVLGYVSPRKKADRSTSSSRNHTEINGTAPVRPTIALPDEKAKIPQRRHNISAPETHTNNRSRSGSDANSKEDDLLINPDMPPSRELPALPISASQNNTNSEPTAPLRPKSGPSPRPINNGTPNTAEPENNERKEPTALRKEFGVEKIQKRHLNADAILKRKESGSSLEHK
jgi:hypothetical protein